MQVVSPLSPAPKFAGKDIFSEVYGKLKDDFGSKLKISSTEEKERDNNSNLEKSWWHQNEIKAESDEDGEGREEEEEEEGDEFSFASVNAENSPITAEEAFEEGQIRPVYPLFNRNLFFDDTKEKALRPPLKKLFVEAAAEEDSEPMGPYCSWKSRTVEEASTRETCRKSNSTGFSKLRRFRDLVLRSNSDGKDAFVFLNNHNGDADKNQSSSSSTAAKLSRVKSEKGKEKTRTEKKKQMRTKSAHERLYMRNRAMREEGKRRSYLPYKHVGFFTNVNGLTKNVHPF